MGNLGDKIKIRADGVKIRSAQVLHVTVSSPVPLYPVLERDCNSVAAVSPAQGSQYMLLQLMVIHYLKWVNQHCRGVNIVAL